MYSARSIESINNFLRKPSQLFPHQKSLNQNLLILQPAIYLRGFQCKTSSASNTRRFSKPLSRLQRLVGLLQRLQRTIFYHSIKSDSSKAEALGYSNALPLKFLPSQKEVQMVQISNKGTEVKEAKFGRWIHKFQKISHRQPQVNIKAWKDSRKMQIRIRTFISWVDKSNLCNLQQCSRKRWKGIICPSKSFIRKYQQH